jgi:hypothetical protein
VFPDWTSPQRSRNNELTSCCRLKNHRDMCRDWKAGKLPLEPPKLVEDLEVVQTPENQAVEASRDVSYEEE